MIHETTQDFRIRYNLSQSGLNRTRMERVYKDVKESEFDEDYEKAIRDVLGFIRRKLAEYI